jgi:lysylphosphatidylglycerol synthetase-like protein (DUF2156 family)
MGLVVALLVEFNWRTASPFFAIAFLLPFAVLIYRDSKLKFVSSGIQCLKSNKWLYRSWIVLWILFVLISFLWPRPTIWRLLFAVPSALLFAPAIPMEWARSGSSSYQ